MQRVGVVYQYRFDRGEKTSEILIESLTNLKVEGIPADFHLRTAFKRFDTASLIMADKNDFKNTIIDVVAARSDLLSGEKTEVDAEQRNDVILLTVDSQAYFRPEKAFSGAMVQAQFAEVDAAVASLQKTSIGNLSKDAV